MKKRIFTAVLVTAVMLSGCGRIDGDTQIYAGDQAAADGRRAVRVGRAVLALKDRPLQAGDLDALHPGADRRGAELLPAEVFPVLNRK